MTWPVRDRATFRALKTAGRRARADGVSVTWLPGDPPPRVAYAIGKRAGGAVVRNRVRRRMRAVMAELAPSLRPGAYLVAAGADAATMPFADLRHHVAAAVERLGTA